MSTVDRPTRDQLVALLFSDAASGAWEHEALSVLALDRGASLLQPRLEAVVDLVEVVSAEIDVLTDSLKLEPEDDLNTLACGARRAAVLLLHAAFAAEQALEVCR